MQMNRRELLTASAAGAAILRQGGKAFAAPAGNIQVAIDAAKVGAPITPLIFGGYYGAGYDASLGRDADRQEVCQSHHQRRRAGAADQFSDAAFLRRALSSRSDPPEQ